jgi:hypothetical protein
VLKYTHTADYLSHLPLLNALHRDPGSGQYLDWGLHSEDVELVRDTAVVDGRLQVRRHPLGFAAWQPPPPQPQWQPQPLPDDAAC